MTIRVHPLANAARNAGPGLLPYMDSGAGVARVRLYPAPRSALVTDAVGVALIVELPLLKPSATVDAAGVMTLQPGAPGLNAITAAGVWAVIVNASGETVLDCDASAPAGTGEIWLTTDGTGTTTLFAGGSTTLDSGLLG